MGESSGVLSKISAVLPIERRGSVLAKALVVVAFASGLVGWLESSPHVIFTSSLLIIIIVAAFSLTDFRRHVILFFYLAAFTTFIYGRVLVVTLFGYRSEDASGILGTYAATNAQAATTFGLYHLFIIGFVGSYGIVEPWFRNRFKSEFRNKWKLTIWRRLQIWLTGQAFRRACLVIFYLSLIPYVYYLIRVGSFVSANGYYEYQQNRSEAAPEVLRSFNDLITVSFFFYLASFPRLRALMFPTAVFFIARGGALVTMERNAAVLPILATLAYVISRIGWGSFSRTRIWHGIVAVFGILGAVFVASVLFARMNANRGTGGLDVEPWKAPLEFFYGQGTTINIMALTQRYDFEIPGDKFFSIGPIIEFFQSRVLQLVPGFDYSFLYSNNERHALEGHSFAHYFSFLHMKGNYLNGSGWGSSAPVELWADFGFGGVFVGAIFFGVLVSLVQQWLSAPGLLTFLALMLSRGIFFSPRSSYTEYFMQFNVRALVAIGFVLAVALVFSVGRSFRIFWVKGVGSGSDEKGIDLPDVRSGEKRLSDEASAWNFTRNPSTDEGEGKR